MGESKVLELHHVGEVVVEIHRGNVFDHRADILIMGRNRPLRAELESKSARRFAPIRNEVLLEGKLDALVTPRADVPWKRVLSMRYRPREADPRVLCGHVWRVLTDLQNVFFTIGRKYRTEHVAMLPLSCRNPETISVAMAAAIWSYAYHRARALGLHDPMWGWKDPGIRRQMQSVHRIRRFSLFDLEDPGPLVRAFTNEDGCSSRVFSMDAERWAEAPFRPAREDTVR